MSHQDPIYVFGHSEDEQQRLMYQHAAFGPLTERTLREAGIGAGMRVLDVGCGAGDVAFLAARLVGPTGRVIAVDRSSEVLATARARSQELGLSQIDFLQRDAREIALDPAVDGVVGRFVLMYQVDPADAVRAMTRSLRPGGVAAFHELDLRSPRSCCRRSPSSSRGSCSQVCGMPYTSVRCGFCPEPAL